jgi:hypothetical protein
MARTVRCTLSLLLFGACTPAQESEETQRYRFLLQQVCVAYDDLRGRGAVIDTAAQVQWEHEQAAAACDQIDPVPSPDA